MDGLIENPIKMDDFGVPLFSETFIWAPTILINGVSWGQI